MMRRLKSRLITADQLLAMGSDPPYELINGRLRPLRYDTPEHCLITWELVSRVHDFASPRDLGIVGSGRMGCVVSRAPDTVLAPDIAYVAKDRWPKDEDSFFPGAPDLVAETVGLGDRARDMRRKARRWLAAGCRPVWIVWPKRRAIEVYAPGQEVRVLVEGHVLDGGDVLPGFECSVADIFQE